LGGTPRQFFVQDAANVSFIHRGQHFTMIMLMSQTKEPDQMTEARGYDMEARKVSHQSFGIAIGSFMAILGWMQWGLMQQDKRIAVAEAKSEAALTRTIELNQTLTVQLTQLQTDVQWIKLKVDALETRTPRR
jgi:hypothetical protein